MSPIRILSTILLSIAGVLCIALSILMSQGALPHLMFNRWSDLCMLLFGFSLAFMALLAAFEESSIERNYRHHQRMVHLDQKLWDTVHNPKALRALERQ